MTGKQKLSAYRWSSYGDYLKKPAKLRESDEQKAERIAQEEMKKSKWQSDELARRPKGDARKVAMATRLRKGNHNDLEMDRATAEYGYMDACFKPAPKGENMKTVSKVGTDNTWLKTTIGSVFISVLSGGLYIFGSWYSLKNADSLLAKQARELSVIFTLATFAVVIYILLQGIGLVLVPASINKTKVRNAVLYCAIYILIIGASMHVADRFSKSKPTEPKSETRKQ